MKRFTQLVGRMLITASFCFTGVQVAQAATHTVKPGETLWRVAHNHGTDVETVRRLNGLKGNTVKVGQTLKLPSKGGKSVPVAKKSSATKHSTISSKSSQAKAKTAQTKSSKVSKKTAAASAVTVAGAQASSPAQQTSSSILSLSSSSALVLDANTGTVLYAKNEKQVRSIASITKLMTAMVVLDSGAPLSEILTISDEDVDHLKGTSSRLPVGTRLSRYEMLRLALMSSENRASSALARHYKGGRQAFIVAMNTKAAALGMRNTRFADATGLTPANVSTAEELARMVRAAHHYGLIREFTTTSQREIVTARTGHLQYNNSNALLREPASPEWDIWVSKTGFTNEAKRCLVMMANIENRPAVMVFLGAEGRLTPVGDANRVRQWMGSGHHHRVLAGR